LIATGTKPAVNAKVPVNGRNIIDSDQILSMRQIPKTLMVVGGGVIGVEYACMFATLGVQVTIVEKRPRLLEFADSILPPRESPPMTVAASTSTQITVLRNRTFSRLAM
jgi:pyruvate/2-oxoglutarate dehydrogenase complex dihydrolipoamide dehydrogenase (E3) component